MPHVKKIHVKLFELKIRGEKEIRVLFTFYRRGVVLLHAFVKKTEKIARKELQKARDKLYLLD